MALPLNGVSLFITNSVPLLSMALTVIVLVSDLNVAGLNVVAPGVAQVIFVLGVMLPLAPRALHDLPLSVETIAWEDVALLSTVAVPTLRA